MDRLGIGFRRAARVVLFAERRCEAARRRAARRLRVRRVGSAASRKLKQDGKEPFWFINGLEWDSDGATYPHGVEQRFRTYQFDKVFPSFGSFIEDTQWHQFNALKFEIEEMRRHASIQGYVITELTDLHWEANGLMDMQRNTRAYHNRFHEINTDVVIIPRMQRYAVWAGDTASVELEISTGGKALPAAELELEHRWDGRWKNGDPGY